MVSVFEGAGVIAVPLARRGVTRIVEGVHPRQMVVFGSKARGTARPVTWMCLSSTMERCQSVNRNIGFASFSRSSGELLCASWSTVGVTGKGSGMKSKLFSTNDLANQEEFKRDIGHLFRLPAAVLKALPGFGAEALLEPSGPGTSAIRDRASERLGVPRAQLDHCLDVTQFFLRQFTSHGDAKEDSSEALAEDFVALFGATPERMSDYAAYLDQCRTVARTVVEGKLLERMHEQSCLPILQSISTAVDIRALFDSEYRTGADVSSFSPRIEGVVPMGIVRILLHSNSVDELYFQVSPSALESLIGHLRALQKQIGLAAQRIRVCEENDL
jgi:hypothetical protein